MVYGCLNNCLAFNNERRFKLLPGLPELRNFACDNEGFVIFTNIIPVCLQVSPVYRYAEKKTQICSEEPVVLWIRLFMTSDYVKRQYAA